MKLTHSVLSLTLAAGLAGSVAAYRATAGEVAPTPPAPAAQTSPPAPQVVLPGTVFGWAPCKPGSHLERGTCVVEVVRTVVLPAAVPARQSAGGAATPGDGPSEEESEPEGRDDSTGPDDSEGPEDHPEAEDDEDAEDEDHEDEDHEDEDHEDEDHEDEDHEDEENGDD